MKRLPLPLFLITLVFCLTSCSAFHSGVFQSSTALNNGNFTIEKMVTGHSHTFHFLVFGGLNKQALVLEAKKDLYAQHLLKKGEAFANVTVDFKRTFYLVCMRTDVTISADLVQFDTPLPDGESHPVQEQLHDIHFPKLIENVDSTLEMAPETNQLPERLRQKRIRVSTTLGKKQSCFTVGDSVWVYKNSYTCRKGVILNFENHRAWVDIAGKEIKKENLSSLFLYHPNKYLTDISSKLGTKVKVAESNFNNNFKVSTIVGFNKEEVLLQSSFGYFDTQKYSKLDLE